MAHIHLPSVDDAVAELEPAAAVGVQTVVDAMPCAGGRHPERLAEVSRRSGVTASVIMMNRNAQLPKRSSISSIGLAPRLPVIPNVSPTTNASGIRHTRKTSGLPMSRILVSVFKTRSFAADPGLCTGERLVRRSR